MSSSILGVLLVLCTLVVVLVGYGGSLAGLVGFPFRSSWDVVNGGSGRWKGSIESLNVVEQTFSVRRGRRGEGGVGKLTMEEEVIHEGGETRTVGGEWLFDMWGLKSRALDLRVPQVSGLEEVA